MKLRCPKCGSVQEFSDSDRGNVIRCEDCPAKFRAPEQKTPLPPTKTDSNFAKQSGSNYDVVVREGNESSRMAKVIWGLRLQLLAAVAAVVAAAPFFLPSKLQAEHVRVAEVVASIADACRLVAPVLWLIGIALCVVIPRRANARLIIGGAVATGVAAAAVWFAMDHQIVWNQVLAVAACLAHLLVVLYALFRTASFCRFSTYKQRLGWCMMVVGLAAAGMAVIYGLSFVEQGKKLADYLATISSLTFLVAAAMMCWLLQHLSRRIRAEVVWGRWD